MTPRNDTDRTVGGPLKLNGRQKASVLMLVLGAEVAARVMQHLAQDEVDAIALETAQMDQIDPQTVEAVMEEWAENTLGVQSIAVGGVDYARDMLENAFGPQRAGTILKRINNQIADTAGMYRLRQADPQQLSNTLRGEHPQTIAVVLAHLDPAQTAAIIKELGTTVGADVAFRMARMDKVDPQMLQMIEASLRADTDISLARGMSTAGGPEAVASVLNLLSGSQEKELLEGLHARDAALTEQIKNLMFVFEDIIALDDKSMQRLIRDIDVKRLALALKAASQDLKAKLMSGMTQRGREALNEEIEMMGPVRLRDVEGAQAEIVEQVRKLEEAGEIVLSKSGTDDQIIQ